ncbi:MAG: hypothetical protein GYA62_09135 [Bacteroidales bacterium]|nr:hypothetical protein [Bacteroidales bacterium]
MNNRKIIYLIGSLRNEKIPVLANKIRDLKLDVEVFDDWFSPGPEADDYWRKYEKIRGSTYGEALNNWACRHIYEFDKFHIDRANIGVLYMPCGKSGFLELGYMIGKGKKCFILFDEEPQNDRWDIMLVFAKENGGNVCFGFDQLKEKLMNLK